MLHIIWSLPIQNAPDQHDDFFASTELIRVNQELGKTMWYL